MKLCSFCGKEGATKCCGPCKQEKSADVVVYCSKECQRLHWKEHQKVCILRASGVFQSPSLVDFSSLDPLTKREAKDMMRLGMRCIFCTKGIPEDQQNWDQACSRCKYVVYCSTECQQKDWPRHKQECDAEAEKERSYIQDRSDKDFAAVEYTHYKRWLIGMGRLTQVMVRAFLSDEQFRSQPPTAVLKVNVDWNWNYKTFLPDPKPIVVPVEEFEEPFRTRVKNAVKETMAYAHNILREEETVSHVVLYSFGGTMSCQSAVLFPQVPQISEANLERFLKSRTVSIHSQLLSKESWQENLWNNLNYQVQSLQGQTQWQTFLMDVFHMCSKEPRHRTHCLCIDFDFGFELGQLFKLISFEVVTLSQARDIVLCSKAKLPTAAERVVAECFDVEYSPLLQEHRKKEQKCHLLSILFINRCTILRPLVYPAPLVSEYPAAEDRSNLSASQCDQLAALFFQKLQHIVENDLPDVVKPGKTCLDRFSNDGNK